MERGGIDGVWSMDESAHRAALETGGQTALVLRETAAGSLRYTLSSR